MQVKLTKRIFVFAVPKEVKKTVRKQETVNGVEKDVEVEEVSIELEQKTLEAHVASGGPNLSLLLEETVEGEGRKNFGDSARLVAVKDVVSMVEVPFPE
jgi:hypothetical protein